MFLSEIFISRKLTEKEIIDGLSKCFTVSPDEIVIYPYLDLGPKSSENKTILCGVQDYKGEYKMLLEITATYFPEQYKINMCRRLSEIWNCWILMCDRSPALGGYILICNQNDYVMVEVNDEVVDEKKIVDIGEYKWGEKEAMMEEAGCHVLQNPKGMENSDVDHKSGGPVMSE